jgi:hypothetical protein
MRASAARGDGPTELEGQAIGRKHRGAHEWGVQSPGHLEGDSGISQAEGNAERRGVEDSGVVDRVPEEQERLMEGARLRLESSGAR